MLKKQLFFRSLFILVATLLFLQACSTYQVNNSPRFYIQDNCPVALLIFNNNTQTPQANNAVMAITADLLRSKGLQHIYTYYPKSNQKTLIPGLTPVPSVTKQLNWARAKHFNYALVGSVNEWQYKIGLDGEPVVGVSMQLIDLQQRHVVWSSVGAVHGSPHAGLATTAQTLIQGMLNSWQVSKTYKTAVHP